MYEFQLTKIEIEGFKSIPEQTIEFDMINVLIGSNGAGKTNLVSLFSMLQAIIEGNLQLYIAKHGGPDVFLNWGRKNTERLTVRFYFGNNGYGFTLEPTNDNRMIFNREWFYWNMTGESNIARGHTESAWKTGTHNRIDEYVQPILEKQKWRVYHFHDTGESALVKQIQGINDNMELANDARNLAAFLYRLKETENASYQQIVASVRMVAPYFDDFVLRPNPMNKDKISLEWKSVGSDIPFIASQLSDGTLRYICLATLLLQPSELQPETIIIDEPELGLHPYAVSILAGMIKKVAVYKQVILSTQSVELLNEFNVRDVIVVNNKAGASTFSRLDAESLRLWLEDDYTLGEMWKHNLIGGRP